MICEQTIERLFHSLIAGDSRQARHEVEAVLSGGTTVDELIIEAYRPLAGMIEALARARQLSGRARDHATVLLQNLLDDARAGTLQNDEPACEIETVVRRPAAAAPKVDAGASMDRRAIAAHRRGSELKTPFTAMSFRNGVLRVRLVGPQVNEREAAIMRDEIGRALDLVGPGLRAFILDLSEVQAMASCALGMCVELHKTADELGARALMTGVHGRLADLVSLLNVDRLYECAGAAA